MDLWLHLLARAELDASEDPMERSYLGMLSGELARDAFAGLNDDARTAFFGQAMLDFHGPHHPGPHAKAPRR